MELETQLIGPPILTRLNEGMYGYISNKNLALKFQRIKLSHPDYD